MRCDHWNETFLISTLLTNIFMFFFNPVRGDFFPLDEHSCNTPIDLHYLFVLICVSPRALMQGTKSTLKKTPWKKWCCCNILCWMESFLHTLENTLQILFLCPTWHKQKFHWNLFKLLLTECGPTFTIFHKHKLSTLPIWTTTHVLFWIQIGSFWCGNTTRTWLRRWLSIYPAWSSWQIKTWDKTLSD